MWLSKIKKKKLQYILLGVIFAIAIALISVSSIITIVSSSFAEKYYDGDSTPDIEVITVNDSVADKSYEFYEKEKDRLRNYKKYDMISVYTNLSFNDKVNDNSYTFIIPIKDVKDLSNKIEFVEGEEGNKTPEKGEMWISSTTANLKDIGIGDYIKVNDITGKEVKFKVSAIVNDSNQSSTAIGVIYTYINEDDKSKLEGLSTAKLITMNCDGDAQKICDELVNYIDEPIEGVALSKDLLIMSATMTSIIIGGLGLMSSIVLVIVLMLILRSNIKNNILKEYKSIGIYKSMGYTSKKIRKIYLNSYGIVSLISSLLGILIGIPLVTWICNIMFKNLGVYKFDLMSLVIMIVAFIVFNLLVYVNLHIAIRSINKINPVEAINIGITSSKEKIKKSLIKNNSSSIAMAVNDIYKYKKNNFIVLIMFTVIFYMATLFINITNTMLTLRENYYQIFGVANSDLVISTSNDMNSSINNIVEYLDNDSRVKDYYVGNDFEKKKIFMDSEKYEVDSGILNVSLYNKYNEKDFSIREGLNPRNNKEIAVSVNIMENNNFKIGDYITLKVEGEDKDFLITGSYASMSGNGQSIRLTTSVISDDCIGNTFCVKLKDINDYKNMKADIENENKDVLVERYLPGVKDSASQVVETSVPISLILVVGVIIFGLVNIVNMLLSNNIDNRKSYGIMKSIGFTSKYIKRRSNFRILSIAIIGAIIGTIINIFTSDKLMELTIGFKVFNFSYKYTLIMLAITFAFIMITMHICNRSIKKISTVELISE